MPNAFTMSPAHMEAFSAQQQMRFEDETFAYLERAHPAETRKMGEEWIRKLIRVGIDDAHSYGITTEAGVAGYIELMLVVSPDFDDSPKTPWARDILTNPFLTGQQKLDGIYEHLMFAGPGGGR